MFFLKNKINRSEIIITPNNTEYSSDNLEVFKTFFTTILQGNMDITREIDIDQSGSVGKMINKMMNKIHESIKGIVFQMVDVSRAAFNMGNNVDTLKYSLQEQNSIITGISESTILLSNDILDISDKTKKLSTRSLDAIESTNSGTSRMEAFNEELKNVGDEIKGTQQFMGSLKESTNSIHILTELINDITSRLDILSINASIEAARAGNAGSGFAVIAKEIRTLSSQSGIAVNRVNSIVDTVINDMTDVDVSLDKADVRVKECLNKSDYINADFINISTINTELNSEVKNISRLLESQEESSSGIKDLVDKLSEQEKPILELVDNTETMSKQLHSSVDGVLETASFKLDWHNVAIDALHEMENRIKSTKEEDLVYFLNKQFISLNYVELFYVMDMEGRQITDNIVNPRFSDAISTDGKNQNRSDRDYVKKILNDSSSGYVSGIYVSSASRDLCVTVSIAIDIRGNDKVIIAADMNLQDFIKL